MPHVHVQIGSTWYLSSAFLSRPTTPPPPPPPIWPISLSTLEMDFIFLMMFCCVFTFLSSFLVYGTMYIYLVQNYDIHACTVPPSGNLTSARVYHVRVTRIFVCVRVRPATTHAHVHRTFMPRYVPFYHALLMYIHV